MSKFHSTVAETVNQESNSTRPSVIKKIASVTTQNLFAIEGGPVLIKSIIGRITTAFQSSTNNLKFTYTVNGGSSQDLCAVTNGTGAAVNKMLTINGVRTDALKISELAGISELNEVTTPRVVQVLAPGVIALNGSATTTGAADFSVVYEPLAPGARIVAI